MAKKWNKESKWCASEATLEEIQTGTKYAWASVIYSVMVKKVVATTTKYL